MSNQQQFIIVGVESKFFEGAEWVKDHYTASWKSFPLTTAGVKQAAAYAEYLEETETVELKEATRYEFRITALTTTSREWMDAQARMLAGVHFGLWSLERKLCRRQEYETVLMEGDATRRTFPPARIDAVMTEYHPPFDHRDDS